MDQGGLYLVSFSLIQLHLASFNLDCNYHHNHHHYYHHHHHHHHHLHYPPSPASKQAELAKIKAETDLPAYLKHRATDSKGDGSRTGGGGGGRSGKGKGRTSTTPAWH